MYHVMSFEPGLWTVGTGTPGVDWEPIADYDRADVAQAEAERRNSPQVYALIDEPRARLDKVENMLARSARVDNENNPDWQGY